MTTKQYKKHLIGNRYNFLTLIEKFPTTRKGKFKCDCGKEIIIAIRDPARGRQLSCGCQRFTPEKRKILSDRAYKLQKEGKLKIGGSKGVSRKTDEYKTFRYCLGAMKNKSKKGCKIVNVTLQDLKEQWDKQNGVCPYSNVKLKLRRRGKDKFLPFEQASVDRINSSKPYEKGNIQFISVTCNFAKNNMSDDQMKQFINIVTKNNYQETECLNYSI